MSTNTYQVTVEGMSCDHCVAAVTKELTALEGVASVVVDLDTGRVAYESSRVVPADELAAAVDEAGFELADRA